jgi:hypothetical protein
MKSVADWSHEHGFGRYAPVFVDNDIDFEALALLDEHHVERLGVSLGHRKQQARVPVGLNDGRPGACSKRWAFPRVA